MPLSRSTRSSAANSVVSGNSARSLSIPSSTFLRSAPASDSGRGLTILLIDRAHDGLHDVCQTRGGHPQRATSVAKMAPCDYLFVFAQAHEKFRIPELRSIAELHGFPIGFNHYTADDLAVAVKRPFMILRLGQEEHARLLASRCILIRYAQLLDRPSVSLTLHQVDLRVLCTGDDLQWATQSKQTCSISLGTLHPGYLLQIHRHRIQLWTLSTSAA